MDEMRRDHYMYRAASIPKAKSNFFNETQSLLPHLYVIIFLLRK